MDRDQKADSKRGNPYIRFVGAGVELASFSLCFGLIGFTIDHWVESERQFGLAFGSLIGFSMGMVRFVILAGKANRPYGKSELRSQDLPDVRDKTD